MSFSMDTRGSSYAKTKKSRDEVNGVCALVVNIEPHAVDAKGVVKKRGYGGDDSFFQVRSDLHREFPRGYSRTIFTSGESEQEEIVRGFFKFSGRTEGDEDDSLPCNSLVPSDLESIYTKVLRIEKLNGKFAVVRIIEYGGRFYLIGGSKGVHRRVSLDQFERDMSNLDVVSKKLVQPILRLFYEQYTSCSEENRVKIRKCLVEDQNSLCGEFEDGLHLEPQNGLRLRWYGLAYSGVDFQDEASLSGNIVANLGQITGWGLPVPRYELLSKGEDLLNRVSERYLCGREGYVKHYLNDADETVFVEKTKTTWYVLVRMLREAIKSCDNIMVQIPGKIASRLRLRNSFLRLPETMLVIWYRLMLQFCKWFVAKGYTKEVIGFTDKARGMGNVWVEFLRETPDVTDDFGDPLVYIADRPIEMLSEVYQSRLLVVLQGIPGLGKTVLAKWMKEHAWLCDTLEQDTFNGNGGACLKALGEMLASDARVIILARNNAKPYQYAKYIRAATDAGWKTLAVTPSELMETGAAQDSLITICEEAVKTRTGHLTFDKLKPADRVKIVRSFRSQFTPARITSELHHLHRMTWLEDGNRRTLESLGSELLGVICRKLEALPEPVYMGLPVSPEFREVLSKLISRKMADGSMYILDHLTLMHSSNHLTNPELWSSIKSMSGQVLKIQVVGLSLKDDSHAVFECRVVGEDDVELNRLVDSRFPHITGVVPLGESGKISLELNSKGEFTETNIYPIPLECISRVTPFY